MRGWGSLKGLGPGSLKGLWGSLKGLGVTEGVGGH